MSQFNIEELHKKVLEFVETHQELVFFVPVASSFPASHLDAIEDFWKTVSGMLKALSYQIPESSLEVFAGIRECLANEITTSIAGHRAKDYTVTYILRFRFSQDRPNDPINRHITMYIRTIISFNKTKSTRFLKRKIMMTVPSKCTHDSQTHRLS